MMAVGHTAISDRDRSRVVEMSGFAGLPDSVFGALNRCKNCQAEADLLRFLLRVTETSKHMIC